MKKLLILVCLAIALILQGGCNDKSSDSSDASSLTKSGRGGNGYGGGQLSTPSGGGGGNGSGGGSVDGPLNDKGSLKGDLFGDLYVILRHQGEDPATVGGQPILTEDFVEYTTEDGDTAIAPTPSHCVQPVASFARWGDIGTPDNLIPLVKTYDATWGRTECEIDPGYFIPPDDGDSDIEEHQWDDPVNGTVTYPNGVLWTDMVQEVHFGRLNIGRAPAHVLQAAFDEAITTINSAKEVRQDASGRLLLVRDIPSATEVDPATGIPVMEEIVKAIDSPRENMALYIKLLKDGHLITPGDERAPIDRSVNGGIPISKLLDLVDGPSKALRPTIDIAKLRAWGLGYLVDVEEKEYETYTDNEGALQVVTPGGCPVGFTCESWTGLLTADGSSASDSDFSMAATFFASAGDKTGTVTIDQLVYMNSILGINKVVGYSDYNDDGTPADGAIDYSAHPVYFDFSLNKGYSRDDTFKSRGNIFLDTDGSWDIGSYTGEVSVLQGGEDSQIWTEDHYFEILTNIPFRSWGLGVNGFPDFKTIATDNIAGFCQEADDDLSVIEFVHTYQIPGLR
ncbi:hypothetical protein DSLASN_39950 [Desulfoluna limicola]|uniref:Lipoprotein n=1 Tax=Desulfoluna limicola TaxID=2810562 RepID=A0ABM7PLQ9_9BACT|nr:hypothetical protein [Desulfoluna limicola]BCS98363.1 hypothetical protein DSLASN_39950 [Desulfoluna limicola]